MLFSTLTDTFLYEFHVQHGRSHDGVKKTQKFHAVQTQVSWLVKMNVHTKNDAIINVSGFRLVSLFSNKRSNMD